MWTPVKVLRLLAVVLVGTNLPVVLGNATETTEDSIMPTEDPEIVEMEEGFRRLNEDVTRFAAKQFLPIVSEIIYDPRLSGECAGGLLKIGTALRDGEGWVLMSKSYFCLLSCLSISTLLHPLRHHRRWHFMK